MTKENRKLPLPEKRGLSREEAAEHCGVGTDTFNRLVRAGTLPQPLRLGGRVVWDAWALNRCFDRLSGFTASHETQQPSPTKAAMMEAIARAR